MFVSIMGLPQPRYQRLSALVLPVVTLMMATLPASLAAKSKPELTISPSTLHFGKVALGNRATLKVRLHASGGTVDVSSISSSSSQFGAARLKFPLRVPAGKEVTVDVTFSPSRDGGASGVLSFVSNAARLHTYEPFTGTGTGVSKPELTISPSALNFGKVAVGDKVTRTVGIRASGRAIAVSSISSSSSQFRAGKLKFPLTVPMGKEVPIDVTFSPSRDGSASGVLSFVSDSERLHRYEPFTGTGTGASKPELTISPSALNFGKVAVGDKSTLTVELHANGGTVEVSSISSSSSQFGAGKLKFPLTVPAGKEVSIEVTFFPSRDGGASGELSFVSNAERSTVHEPFAGTGTGVSKPELSISPSSLNFGKVAVGGTATLTLGLHASGGNVDVSSISSSSSQFDVQKLQLPLTVPAGKEVSLNVTFRPKNNGNASGALSFASNAGNPRISEVVAGTGTAPYVSLSWIASTSEHVTGYNVYRSTSAGGAQTKINSRIDPDTTYSDATVVPGHTYYYSTTAVNSSGKESAHSERVEVAVP